MPFRRTAVLAGLLVLLTASCSDVGTTTAAPTAAASPSASPAPTSAASAAPTTAPVPASATMTISGFAYDVPGTVPPGAQVTVVNQDREAHTVTVDRGAVRLTVLPGETAVFRAPTEPGPHQVTCDLHGGMDAVLVVR